jgi:hypothetical protein
MWPVVSPPHRHLATTIDLLVRAAGDAIALSGPARRGWVLIAWILRVL